MFFALAGLGLSALSAGMSAKAQNDQAYEQAVADAARARKQVQVNALAANDSYYSIQQNLNQQIKQALYKREAMLIKLTQARGTYAAQEGRVGKSARRVAALETFGTWGRDSARLSETMTDLSESTQFQLEQVARRKYEADVNAAAMVQQPGYRDPNAGRVNPGLAIATNLLGNASQVMGQIAPNPFQQPSNPLKAMGDIRPASQFAPSSFSPTGNVYGVNPNLTASPGLTTGTPMFTGGNYSYIR